MMNRSKCEDVTKRRSSLRVNLSFDTNSIDSGNGSCIRNQSNVTYDDQRELVLNENCQLLKDAILTKTRELFDDRNELLRKTKSIMIIDSPNENVLYDTTPRTITRRPSLKIIDKKQLSQKRLFVNENNVGRNTLEEIDISPISKTRVTARSFYNLRSKCEEGNVFSSTPIENDRTDQTKNDAISMEMTKIQSIKIKDNILNDEPSSMRMNTSVDTIVENNNSLNDTIIVENSSLREERCSKDNEPPVIIEDSMMEKNLPKGRRRLLPLRQNSDLYSFSPIEETQPLTPKSPKEFKRKQKHKKTNVESNLGNKVTIEVDDHRSMDIDDNCCSIKEKKIEVKKKRRKVLSKKIIIKKIPKYDVLSKLEESAHHRNKPSASDFHSDENHYTGRVKSKSRKIYLVVTGYPKSDKSLVRSVMKCIGTGQLQSQVNKHTTHVITTGVRTINLLRGIIRGCWLVNLEWALRSLEHKKWLNPEEFEISHFSKAVQENRRDRQMFGISYVPELFFSCGLIHVEKNTKPPRDSLNELIKLAGGRIIENFNLAKIVIGPNGLRETWVLDSITTGQLQTIEQYEV